MSGRTIFAHQSDALPNPTALTPTSASLLVQSCRELVAANGGSTPVGDDQLFVHCKVAGDPEWVEFRLVTRRQCAQAAGVVGR